MVTQTSPILTSIKHDEQYLKSTLINKPKHSSQVQLTNTITNHHNTFDKSNVNHYMNINNNNNAQKIMLKHIKSYPPIQKLSTRTNNKNNILNTHNHHSLIPVFQR
ncbi:unnamed protein product, partial [Schistosoma mattheei]